MKFYPKNEILPKKWNFTQKMKFYPKNEILVKSEMFVKKWNFEKKNPTANFRGIYGKLFPTLLQVRRQWEEKFKAKKKPTIKEVDTKDDEEEE